MSASPASTQQRERRIGVYICHCGNNISRIIDIKEVVEFSRSLPFVVVVRDYPYMCSYQGQRIIEDDIKNYCLNRIVVAACSPRIHEQTFRACCENAGLNPFLFEQANIREQCSWVHDDREKATEKAKSVVRGAVARSSLLEPLEENEVPVYKSALVLGGGIAGITA
ncbi:disulfide reductase, partial [Methanosarcinales archaeon]